MHQENDLLTWINVFPNLIAAFNKSHTTDVSVQDGMQGEVIESVPPQAQQGASKAKGHEAKASRKTLDRVAKHKNPSVTAEMPRISEPAAENMKVTLPPTPVFCKRTGSNEPAAENLTVIIPSSPPGHARTGKCGVEESMSSKDEMAELLATIAQMKSENKDLNGRIEDLKKQLNSTTICADSKDHEILSLRQSRNKDRLELKNLKESENSLAICNELLTAECSKKDCEMKNLKNLSVRQKKEIKRLLGDNDGLIKKISHMQQKPEDGNETVLHQQTAGLSNDNRPKASTADSTTPFQQQRTSPSHYIHHARQHHTDQQSEPRLAQGLRNLEPNMNTIPSIVNGICSTGRKPTDTNKIDILLVGDASVRGLGPLIQDSDIDGHVVVRAGHTLKEGARDIRTDTKMVTEDTVIITGYGVRELETGSIEQAKNRMDRMINLIEAEGSRAKVGILKIPPQIDSRRNLQAKELNSHLLQKCKNAHLATVIDSKLSFNDISRDGMFINRQGQLKMAAAIKMFARSNRGRQSAEHKHSATPIPCI
jgi:hypothetical protein